MAIVAALAGAGIGAIATLLGIMLTLRIQRRQAREKISNTAIDAMADVCIFLRELMRELQRNTADSATYRNEWKQADKPLVVLRQLYPTSDIRQGFQALRERVSLCVLSLDDQGAQERKVEICQDAIEMADSLIRELRLGRALVDPDYERTESPNRAGRSERDRLP